MFKKLASFIKFEHTLFSLPLLFAGAALARPWAGWGQVAWGRLGLIVLAGTGARASALALNRVLDRQIDARNPRTKDRDLPRGTLRVIDAYAVVGGGLGLYLAAAYLLDPWLLKLAALPFAVFILYPLMKRFTWTCHFGVGLGLALAPLGGALGYVSAWPPSPAVLWLSTFTFCWVSGFDILYATLDEAFDKQEGLHSIPANLGRERALDLALVLHGLALLSLGALVRFHLAPMAGPWAWVFMGPAAGLLLLEQKSGYSLEPGSRFFTINAWVGVAVSAAVLLSLR